MATLGHRSGRRPSAKREATAIDWHQREVSVSREQMTAELATTQAELEARTEARPQEAPAEPRPPVKIVWRLEPRCTVMGVGGNSDQGGGQGGGRRSQS